MPDTKSIPKPNRGQNFVDELADTMVSRLRADHTCFHEPEIARLLEAREGIREDVQEIKNSVKEITKAVAANAKEIERNARDILVIRSERKTVRYIVSGVIGALGGGGVVGGILKFLHWGQK